MVMQIADEVEVCSDLTDAELIDELHLRGVNFTASDSRDRLVSRLATARVTHPAGVTYQDKASANLKQGVDKLENGVKQSSWDYTAAAGVPKAVAKKVGSFAKARTSTSAEMAASEYLQSTSDIEFSDETDLSPDDITACLQELRAMSSFDAVTHAAGPTPGTEPHKRTAALSDHPLQRRLSLPSADRP